MIQGVLDNVCVTTWILEMHTHLKIVTNIVTNRVIKIVTNIVTYN